MHRGGGHLNGIYEACDLDSSFQPINLDLPNYVKAVRTLADTEAANLYYLFLSFSVSLMLLVHNIHLSHSVIRARRKANIWPYHSGWLSVLVPKVSCRCWSEREDLQFQALPFAAELSLSPITHFTVGSALTQNMIARNVYIAPKADSHNRTIKHSSWRIIRNYFIRESRCGCGLLVCVRCAI